MPFLLDEKSKIRRKSKGERIKADIIGPPHKAGASPPCRPWPAHSTRSVFGKLSLENSIFQFQQAPSGMSSLRRQVGKHRIYD